MINNLKKRLKRDKKIVVKINTRPNAAQTRFREIMPNGVLKLDLAAPPDKDKANKEMIKFLAKQFSASKQNIKILSGAHAKIKILEIKVNTAF